MPPTRRLRQAKHFRFTRFQLDDVMEHPIINPETWKDMRYCVFQLERCPRTSRLHYQGYVQFLERKRLRALKQFDGVANWGNCDGTADENRAYCTKEDTRMKGPWEFGTMTSQGRRKDLEEIRELIDNGATDQQLGSDPTTALTFIKNERSFQRYRAYTGKTNHRT